jgi:putative nucleotidyltransferase with HDIG domain
MNIPSKIDCYKMIRDMGMMDHIVAHSIRVCQVAMLLVKCLNAKGFKLDRDLVRAAALLHDITKTRSFNTHENHAETAQTLLQDAGFPEVSRIVGQHVQIWEMLSDDTLQEVEIINYSDKRVLHDQVVSLEERFDYIMGRYAKNPSDRKRVHFLTEKTKSLETKIFQNLSFSPQSLEAQLNAEVFTADLKAYHKSDK